jgi:hypothetical protein
MNSYGYESQFGPPSDLIDIGEFIHDAHSPPDNFTALKTLWNDFPEETRNAIAAECASGCVHVLSLWLSAKYSQNSVSETKSSLLDVWTNPRLHFHLTKKHDDCVRSIHESADASNRVRRKRVKLTDQAHENVDIREFQSRLDSIQLRSWP